MGWARLFPLSRSTRIGHNIDWLLCRFAIYLVPIVIGLGTIAVMLWSPREFGAADGTTLVFRAVQDKTAALKADEALQLLRQAPLTDKFGTHLSETPVWFVIDPPRLSTDGGTYIEFPSRHAQSIECWNAQSKQLLGSADRTAAHDSFHAVKAGFALKLDERNASGPVLCKGTFSGPAYLTAVVRDERNLSTSALDFERSASLITGGLLTLAVFVFVTALINREWTYVIFAAWLVGNLRLSANALGFDTEWLGRLISPAYLGPLRQLTFAAYYLLTVTLFGLLFRRELRIVGLRWLLRAVQCGGVVLLVAAFVTDYAHFIPMLWALSSVGMFALIFLLAQLVLRARSRTVLWYVASLAIVLFAFLSEILAAAFGARMLFGGVNSVVTSLSSSMMAAFAIAEQMRAERERRRQMQIELRNTYDVAPIGLFTLDGDGHFIRANPTLHTMLGLKRGEYRVRHFRDYFESGAWDALHRLALKGSAASLEIDGARPGGIEPRRYSLKAILSNGSIEGSLEDVTERSRAIDRLHFLVDHDPLTGSLNRRGIERAITRLRDENRSWALAYIDLDRFKLINDLFGHMAGDEVLKLVAARLATYLEGRYPVGRIGGDEFVCVLEDASIERATEQCRDLVAALSATPYQIGARSFQVKASIGVVECSPSDRVQDALAHADRACRESKRGGHGRLVTYGKGAAAFEERAREIGLVETLGQSRLPEGLFLVMQPIMSMSDPFGSLNFEVLLRLRSPNGSITPAGQLIAAAEDSGNISAIDRWVLTSVLEWISTNRTSLSNTRFVCVNLSGGSLNDEQFMEEIFELLGRYRSVAHYLCLEITESVALHDLENTQRFIARVHDMGAKIALDDFGAGHTSFKYLKELSADALKIDGAFVRTMCQHPADTAIVEAIVALARNLGMRSIAEWVEDVDTLRALKEIGVDYVQGFVIAKPQESIAILGATSAASFVDREDVTGFLEEQYGDMRVGGEYVVRGHIA
jgi:diguanylate cyclase (GGDEF)-like protein